MRILVVGGTGFVGGAIARHLLAAGHDVRVLSRSPAETQEPGLEMVRGDVTEPETLVEAVAGIDVVVQAAQFEGAPVEDPKRGLTYAAVDRDGTLNLLAALRDVYAEVTAGPDMSRFPDGAPRFMYVSGISVSSDSRHPWDQAKWQAEEAVRGSGLDWTIVRCCWVVGRGDASLNRLIGYSDLLPFVPIFGNGKGRLTPVFVEDVGRLFALMVEHAERSIDTTFGLGGPDLLTLDDLLRSALKAKGRRRAILHIPRWMGKAAGAIARHLPGRPLSPGAVDFITQEGALSAEQRTLLAERFPGFTTTSLEEAFSEYLAQDSHGV